MFAFWSRSGFPRLVLWLALSHAVAASAASERIPRAAAPKDMVFDEFVHNAGELQMNITNWGLLGSYPNSPAFFADQPSAMWPAGSGVEYLFAAGLWVGAVQNGVPLVTTSQFEAELRPNPEDPLDTIWAAAQGQANGARYPDPGEDDDGDGSVNEDPLNGLDDDGDGAIDEDFAAIGNQHFRCVMRDDRPLAREDNPEHQPLNISVVQETFQWENDQVDDFVGFQFTLTNVGNAPLQQVFVGFWADPDCGPRDVDDVASDDLLHFEEDPTYRAPDGSSVPLSIACAYDADGDGGRTPGWLGMMFLDHPTDPTGENAPEFVRIRSFQSLQRNTPFDRGGDPNNDPERYELLSTNGIDNTPPLFTVERANDARILLSNGPFDNIEPGESLTFQMAIVMGEGLAGLKANAAQAALTFYGGYFDRDGDSSTGVKGRESRVCAEDFPPGSGVEITDLFLDCAVDPGDGVLAGDRITEADLDEDGCVYRNGDCPFETLRSSNDCSQDGPAVEVADLVGCTGVGGKEFHVPWLVGLAPDPPPLRLWETDGRVHLFWNSLSENLKDIRLQQVDFESYRLWRADGWERPFGSSIRNGPEARLWRLIAEYDRVDAMLVDNPSTTTPPEPLPLGDNTGLDVVRYQPEVLRPDSPQAQELAELRTLVDEIVAWRRPAVSVDPSAFLRYVGSDGRVTDVGHEFPELANWDCCYDQADTLLMDAVGLVFYEFVDLDVHNGHNYFYSVTATDFDARVTSGGLTPIGPGLAGDPQSNFQFAVPKPRSQSEEDRRQDGQNIYVFPNPATRDALAEFGQLHPNGDDPTGVRVMFANLPREQCTIRIFTLAGDLVETVVHDGSQGDGGAFWNLVSRNGQEIVSGIYLYSVEAPGFDRVIGRFVVVR